MSAASTTRPRRGRPGLGLAQGSTDFAVAYAKERRQFGTPIIGFQGIRFQPRRPETRPPQRG